METLRAVSLMFHYSVRWMINHVCKLRHFVFGEFGGRLAMCCMRPLSASGLELRPSLIVFRVMEEKNIFSSGVPSALIAGTPLASLSRGAPLIISAGAFDLRHLSPASKKSSSQLAGTFGSKETVSSSTGARLLGELGSRISRMSSFVRVLLDFLLLPNRNCLIGLFLFLLYPRVPNLAFGPSSLYYL